MKWPTPLIEARILKRYKRFLADVEIDGEITTAHVPNTGSMTSCWAPNEKCALSKSDNPNRKMPYTLELTHNSHSWIGVNTANANRLVKEWLGQELIEEFAGYRKIIPEKKIGDSRIDFYLEDHPTLPPCYIEVKSVTLKLDGKAQFPDAVSERALKHLGELIELKSAGFRAFMLFVVQREDVESFSPAASIHGAYAQGLKEAQEKGVEILVYQCKMGFEELQLGRRLRVEM
jgi:sugar fermentation stimulation protein A